MQKSIGRITFVVLAWCVAACSGSATKPDDTTPSRPPDAGAMAIAPTIDGGAAPDAKATAPAVTTPPTDDECAALLDHMLRVQFSAHNETKPKQLKVTEEELDKIRADIEAEFIPHCASVFTRDAFNCSMKAETRDQWSACEAK